jgi:hypothetical protein
MFLKEYSGLFRYFSMSKVLVKIETKSSVTKIVEISRDPDVTWISESDAPSKSEMGIIRGIK